MDENLNVKIVNIWEFLSQRSGNTFLPYQTTIYKHVIHPMTPTLLQRTRGVLRRAAIVRNLKRWRAQKLFQNSSTNQLLSGLINTVSHCTQEKTLRFYCPTQQNTLARTHFPLRIVCKTNTEIETTRNISPDHLVLPSWNVVPVQTSKAIASEF